MATNYSALLERADAAPEPADERASATLRDRIESEYAEMPGLTVTVPQATRLWGLPPRQTEQILSRLVDEGVLKRDSRGAYRRDGCPRCS